MKKQVSIIGATISFVIIFLLGLFFHQIINSIVGYPFFYLVSLIAFISLISAFVKHFKLKHCRKVNDIMGKDIEMLSRDNWKLKRTIKTQKK